MIRLECRTGGHNKFYEFHTTIDAGHVTVRGLYGAIGQAPQTSFIYDGTDAGDAAETRDKKQAEKMKKGYRLVSTAPDPAPKHRPMPEDTIRVVWPMNAQGVKDDRELQDLLTDPHYYAQEKLDGMRAIVHVTKGGLRIFSRSAGVADPTKPLEKTASLPHLASLEFPGFEGTILDCEILAKGQTSAQLSGNVHRKNGENGTLKLWVFDILSFGGMDLSTAPLAQRLEYLDRIRPKFEGDLVHFLPWLMSSTAKRVLYDDILSLGGEGVMLKHRDGLYEEGARPAGNWYKMKKQATFDCVVMGFTPGQGRYAGGVGAVVFGQYVNGMLVELGQASGMTDGIRKDMGDFPNQYTGKVVEIKGQERLRSGAIRHPQFKGMRPDKSPKSCVYNPNEQ